jgi:4-amino-4-deoxy-L-arabinose transferase-like glycosyltransferase
MTAPAAEIRKTSYRSYPLLALFLFLSASLSLLWSHSRLLWNDEFLSFYTDRVATFREVILVQLHHPISLDPPTYHLLSHLSMDLIGHNAMALRLPALAGFLLFQLSLFYFVRRIAGDRSAIIAMAVPVLTASFRYSVEGRPYGLLLGLYALSLLCWQVATQYDDSPTGTLRPSRILPLIGLSLSIALAITSHYFGILILIPVCLGELSRILVRKRFDFGVLTSLALGLASVGLILPFQHALMAYRQHYYIKGVNIHDISQGYRELFIRYTTWPLSLQQFAAVIMIVLVVALALAAYQRFERRSPTEHIYTWIALISMALLPLFGYLFGRFVTHTMEVRYVVAALIAFAATFGIVLERRLRSNTFYYASVALIIIAALAINLRSIVQERHDAKATLDSLTLSPALRSQLAANPGARIYEQDLENFFLDSFYVLDPNVRSRITLLYDADREVLLLKHDTNAITDTNLQHFTSLPIVSYKQVKLSPGPHLLVLFRGGWNWINPALIQDHASFTPLGNALHGQAVSVQWPQPGRKIEQNMAH